MLKIPENISCVLNILTQNGYEAYIVGGCVRDSLLGIEPYDFDVTTSATPQEVITLFPKTLPTGIKHGTVTVMIDKTGIEVTTFRTDGEYNDSRHPENVEFVRDLRSDLSRRDFTVNALAYSEKTGITDLFGGINDLENKILRAVGDPETRFREDALRILRLFRFSSQLGFKIEENTLKAAINLKNGLEKISSERILTEILKALSGKNPNALLPLINSGGLAFLGINKAEEFHSESPELRLFQLLSDTKDPVAVLKRLKASNKLISFTQKLLKIISLKTDTKEEIKNALFLTDSQTVKALFSYRQENDALLREILENKEPYAISHLAVNGEDLKALGFAGTVIGDKLEILRQAVVKDPEKNKKEILLPLTK